MALFSCCPPSPLFLTLFLPPLPLGILSFKRRALMEPFHLDSLSCNFCQLVSASVPICCPRKPFCWWLNKALIYTYRRISSGVILLDFFLWSVVFHFIFYPRSQPGLFSFWFLVIQALSGIGSIPLCGSKSNQTFIDHFYTCCATIALSLLVDRTDFRPKVLWLGWCFCFFIGSLQNTFSHQRHYNIEGEGSM